ncbi:MAG: hypothetical protein JW950_09445 [Deltaproteobacteria bacterium]|nr:hypothetical protein [Deltaproteobacteria bacterium]
MKPAKKKKPVPVQKIKPVQKVQPKTGRLGKWRMKLEALPPRLWTFGGAALLILAVGWFLLAPAEEEAPQGPAPSAVLGTEKTTSRQQPVSSTPPDTRMAGKRAYFIQSVRLEPSEPTRMDSLKAEVEVLPDSPGQLDFSYQWKVNGLVIEDVTGETLQLSPFKKRDLITVTVTPYDGGNAGIAMESPTIAIQNIPPTLELEAMTQSKKVGETIQLQLLGNDPDGGELSFSLESPFLEGMTIDKDTGKISWPVKPGQKGTFYFGAAVQDSDQAKVAKIFDITIE